MRGGTFTAPHPTRSLAVAYGGRRYPLTEERRQHFLGVEKSADEDPRIRTIYEDELAKAGIACAMPAVARKA